MRQTSQICNIRTICGISALFRPFVEFRTKFLRAVVGWILAKTRNCYFVWLPARFCGVSCQGSGRIPSTVPVPGQILTSFRPDFFRFCCCGLQDFRLDVLRCLQILLQQILPFRLLWQTQQFLDEVCRNAISQSTFRIFCQNFAMFRISGRIPAISFRFLQLCNFLGRFCPFLFLRRRISNFGRFCSFRPVSPILFQDC